MKILITGIAGFIGSQIAVAAIDKGYEVFGVDDFSQGYKSNVPKGCKFLEADLTEQSVIDILPSDVECILHLAGQSSGEISFDNPVLDLEKNAVSTLNLINYGIKNKCKKILYASSMSVYGVTRDDPIDETHQCAPLSSYGVGKLAAEHYLNVYKKQLPYTIFRMFNVYGPGQDLTNLRQGMVSIYIAHILKNGHIPIKGALDRFRDFIYINDVVDIWLQAIDRNDTVNECFNLGTGRKTPVSALLAAIQKIIPDFTWSEIESTPGDQFGIYADSKKLKTFFAHHSFISLDEGLARFIKWSKANLTQE